MKEAVVNGSEAPSAEAAPARRPGTDWWGEVKGIFWLLLIVLGFHSFVAKPFYIPSESMLPGLQVGDRLVVNKFIYGWSFVSPTVPDPVAIFNSVVLRRHEDSWAVQFPFHKGRLFGRLPTRGDVVIVTPPGTNSDYIKRVIGLPGDRLRVKDGVVFLNGVAVKRGPLHYVDVRHYGGAVIQDGETCDSSSFGPFARVTAADGSMTCHLPVVTETLPNGRRYDTVELGPSPGDDYPRAGGYLASPAPGGDGGEIVVPANHVFLMGDNRDRSADSRFPLVEQGLGGPVPYENIGGRAEFVTFSLDGSSSWFNPLSWWRALRPGRAGVSLHPVETTNEVRAVSDAPETLVAEPSPHEMRDPAMRQELRRAGVWFGLGGAVTLVVLLIQPILVILAGLIVATMLDGGVRVLGKALPIGRGWRLLIVVVAVVAFLLGTFYLTGVQLTEQVTQLRATVMAQSGRVMAWLNARGLVSGMPDLNAVAQKVLGSAGAITSYVGTAIGALTTLVFILVLGLFFAMEPRIYERGLQWMIPRDSRAEFAITTERMARTLRRLLAGRLMGMAAEGVLTWIALEIGGVPMALVLGIIAGIMAFIPNIGAFITGALMIAVGFSGGVHTGLWALGTWAVVQSFDGYVVVPIVARRTVDLPPALTLSMQILASALFGILGLALADPMTAVLKVALERRSERESERDAGQ